MLAVPDRWASLELQRALVSGKVQGRSRTRLTVTRARKVASAVRTVTARAVAWISTTDPTFTFVLRKNRPRYKVGRSPRHTLSYFILSGWAIMSRERYDLTGRRLAVSSDWIDDHLDIFPSLPIRELPRTQI